MKLMVTGGCGFIGSAVVRLALSEGHDVVNVDKLTYAASETNIPNTNAAYAGEGRYLRRCGDKGYLRTPRP